MACLRQLLPITQGFCWNGSQDEANIGSYPSSELVCEHTDLRSSQHYV